VGGGILFILEIVITSFYCKYLCCKKPLENLEDVPSYKLKSIQDGMMVLHIKTRDAADYLRKELGAKTALKVVDQY